MYGLPDLSSFKARVQWELDAVCGTHLSKKKKKIENDLILSVSGALLTHILYVEHTFFLFTSGDGAGQDKRLSMGV